ncbi:DNA repair protein XRCC2 [Prorops nasuta]|uniref:DNA repair protein XRCC2 n=1 Tax=Prorops nasuta TaxID=863751 RepID=UPI0034CFC68F
MQANIESGVQLLTRLSHRPDLLNLDEVVFPNSFNSKATLEIIGNVSSGKTLLLTQLLAKCILPEWYKEIFIKGCNASAVLINTDHHFKVSKLAELMYFVIYNICKANNSGNIDNKTIKSIVHTSLENLIIINCYESNQFSIALETLDNIFLSNDRIAMVAIDSISSYYWEDRKSGGAWSLNNYVKKLLEIIQNHTLQFNVALIYTNAMTNNKEPITCASSPNLGKINYRVELCKRESSLQIPEFYSTISSFQFTKKLSYTIDTSGIQWAKENA